MSWKFLVLNKKRHDFYIAKNKNADLNGFLVQNNNVKNVFCSYGSNCTFGVKSGSLHPGPIWCHKMTTELYFQQQQYYHLENTVGLPGKMYSGNLTHAIEYQAM